jgi:Xaa-Pro dipeptidase
MAFYGATVPTAVQKIFNIVVDARDASINEIERHLQQKKLPIAGHIDTAARMYIAKHGHGKRFRHTVGHSLGFTSPHGQLAPLKLSSKQKIFTNLGYTIEPGIYLEGKFGVRSEINFYISDDMKMHVTTPVQKEIVKIL